MSTLTAGNVTVSCSLSADTSGNLVFQSGGNVTAMTIDSSQNVGIGTPLPSTRLDVAGNVRSSSGTAYATMGVAGGAAYLQSFDTSITNIPLTFFVGSTERARIDTSGNLLVGTTTNTYGARLVADGSGDNVAANFYRAGTSSGSGIVTFVSNAGGTRTLKSYIDVANGTLVTTSDETQKENLVEIENAADKVCTLRAAIGNYIGGEAKHPFLIAQDVQKVLPEAVAVTPNGKLGMSYTDTIPLLVAAIKEQQQMIEELKAKVAALEAA